VVTKIDIRSPFVSLPSLSLILLMIFSGSSFAGNMDEHDMHMPAVKMEHDMHAPATKMQHDMHAPSSSPVIDEKYALKTSQAAIGRQLNDYVFHASDGREVKLSDYFDKPLVISMIYTSCAHVCPTITRNLAEAVKKARSALGTESFSVLTIGFDTPVDTPEAMAVFAGHQKIDLPKWDFLSADSDTIQRLTRDLGFTYQRSPKGYDHMTQATIIEAGGKVHVQVYGDLIKTQAFVEPLKKMVFGEKSDDTAYTLLTNKVKLFCTTYDPVTDSYHFDYSLFIGIFVGFTVIGGGIWFLINEYRLNKRSRS
jgi:protein SCO1/2